MTGTLEQTGPVKIALWQIQPVPDIDAALSALRQALAAASVQRADVLITPEMFVGGYNIGSDRVAENASRSVPVLAALTQLAREHGMALVTGLALPGPQKPFNACIAIDRTGNELSRYHKTHLFGDVDRQQFSAGEHVSAVFELCGWKVALAICYDIEFPELARGLALKGAEVILTPTANMVPFDSVALRLVPARAEENTTYVAYCNYVGSEGEFDYNGLSCVCGPDGDDVFRAPHGADELGYAVLDQNSLHHARRVGSQLESRRPVLYGDLSEGA